MEIARFTEDETIEVLHVTDTDENGVEHERMLYVHIDYSTDGAKLFSSISYLLSYWSVTEATLKFKTEKELLEFIRDVPMDQLPKNYNFTLG
jgi:hypothetical protein